MLPEVFLSQTGHWNLSGFCFFRIVDYCPSNVMFWAQFGVRNLPTWGNVLAPHGHGACPFPVVFVILSNDYGLAIFKAKNNYRRSVSLV